MSAMKHARYGGVLLLTGLLSACTMQGPGNLRVHEVALYGGSQDRIVWVYGTVNGGKSSIKLGGQTVELRPQIADPLGVSGTLSVNGAATYRTKTSLTAQALSVTRDGDAFTVRANTDLQAVYFTDGGGRWFRLTDALSRGANVRVAARASAFVRGAGQLSDVEADALGAALSNQGALAIGVLARVPDAPLGVEPTPQEQHQTGLYILPGAGNPSSVTPVPPTGGTVNPDPTPPTTGTVAVRELARGSNSLQNGSEASASVSRSLSSFAQVWRSANGTITPAPQVPSVNFTQGAVVTVFAGQKPSGGYGVRFVRGSLTGSTLTLTVDFTTPPPGAITTQSLTSPWLALNVQGRFDRVVVQDLSGNPVSVTQ